MTQSVFAPERSTRRSWIARTFFFNHRGSMWFWSLVIVSVMVYQSYLAINYNSNDTTNWPLKIARLGAYNLLVLLAVMWIPVMRYTTGVVQRFGVEKLFPLEKLKPLHKWLGHSLMAFAVIHGSFYLVYFDSLEGDFWPVLIGEKADLVRSMETTMYEFVTEDESIDVVQTWVDQGWPQAMYQETIAPLMKEDCTKCHSASSSQTYAIPSLPLTSYEDVVSLSKPGILSRQFRINMTGILMLLCFTAMWFTSLQMLRQKKYPWFQKVHRLGYLVAAAGLLHVPRLEFLAAPTLLLTLEWLLNHTRQLRTGAKPHLLEVGKQHVFLSVPLPRQHNLTPGCYVQIRIRQLHAKEWHSISLINSGPSDQAQMIIKDLGDWTHQLQLMASRGEVPKVDIRGPYKSPLFAMWQKRKAGRDNVLVAGGVGITPVLSWLDQFHQETKSPDSVRVIWCFNDWALYEFVQSQVKPLVPMMAFYTGSGDKEIDAVSRGRPQWDQLFEPGKSNVFVCGPKSLVASVTAQVENQPGQQLYIEHF